MQKTALSLVACLLAIAASGASAQAIYKWRDANGQLHLSDTPPPNDTPAKNILQRPNLPAPVHPGDASASATAGGTATGTVTSTGAGTSAAAGTGTPANAGDSELAKRKAKIDQDKATAQAAEKARAEQQQADARAAACSSAQQNARTMGTGGRIVRINANGEREFLDDATIAAELRRAQDAVAQNCGPAH